MFINVQTGEAFVTAEETHITENGVVTKAWKLTRENGTKKTVSDVSFKAWYQEDPEEKAETETMPMPGTEDPHWGLKAAGKLPNPKHAAVAKAQLENAYTQIVGGYENSVADGASEEVPPVEDMFAEVYEEATTHLYGEGMSSNSPAPAAMRFVGKQFLVDALTVIFQQDGYEVPESCYKVTKKKQGAKRTYKDTPDSVGEDEVVMRAFTGMLIGVFKIAKQTKTHITVEAANGATLKFDRKTGAQVGAKNPKFANRIEI